MHQTKTGILLANLGTPDAHLMDYSKEQVITDILDQYERHLNFIHLHREAPGNSVMFPDG